ncbi:hypothetical protein [Natronolimnobius baerhuensis]|uniref:Rubrerythrin-like domain-containing protein n=1 Tax=Natronolimnobius baerhuensis TaxID=253108 RepID=A0A202EDN0_9EURY|nr:hypothetical protein [Natronolimnobius baerhuensis]OVE86352.1 hypothetical protein B2G88_06125 [Natronolimnobius baerhuensis]
MNGQNNSRSMSAGTMMRSAVKSVLSRTDEVTTIEECRRCGKTVESRQTVCPVCDCDDIVEYRIQ